MKAPDKSQGSNQNPLPLCVTIKAKDEGWLRIPVIDILYLEASGNYTDLVTKASKHTIITRIGSYVQELPDGWFLRVHKSYVINKFHAARWKWNNVYIGDIKIPIGEKYKPDFSAYIESIKLKKRTL